jgi:hypothetical protein
VRPACRGVALVLALAWSLSAAALLAETARPVPRKTPAKSAQTARPAVKPAGKAPAGKAGAASAKTAAPALTGQERLSAEAEYRLLQAELQIAKVDKPYLVFLWEPTPQIVVKLKGAVVAVYPLRL